MITIIIREMTIQTIHRRGMEGRVHLRKADTCLRERTFNLKCVFCIILLFLCLWLGGTNSKVVTISLVLLPSCSRLQTKEVSLSAVKPRQTCSPRKMHSDDELILLGMRLKKGEIMVERHNKFKLTESSFDCRPCQQSDSLHYQRKLTLRKQSLCEVQKRGHQGDRCFFLTSSFLMIRSLPSRKGL